VLGVLLIGFNRPDLIADRLLEVEKYCPQDIQIRLSIDGARQKNPKDDLSQREIIQLADKFSRSLGNRFIYKVQSINLGCDAHINHAISESLKEFEAVVCLEDDIEIGSQTINSLFEKYLISKPEILCAMSSFKSNGNFVQKYLRNYWRKSNYFSAWGYLVSSDFWSKFELATDPISISRKLETSSYWSKLPSYKKDTWLGRFERGNIDYQIQLEVFSKNIEISLPLFRMIENIGLGDSRATHTYHKRPKNMFGVGPSTIFPTVDSEIRSSLVNRILNYVDSNTWAGDGFLTVRGRRTGIRTFLRALFNSSPINGDRKT
jgi:hypothetical protein